MELVQGSGGRRRRPGRAEEQRFDAGRMVKDDRRVRMRLSDLALADATYGALIGLPWLTARRAPMGHSPVPEMAA